MRRSFLRVTAALAILGVTGETAAQNAPRVGGAGARYKVIYQLNEGIDQVVCAIRDLRNHPNGVPGMKIAVVVLGHGVDFLVEGAKDTQGHPFDMPVAALASIGVEFRVCRSPLMAFKVPENRLLFEAKVVPAGVAEITHLQQEEGFAYIKP